MGMAWENNHSTNLFFLPKTLFPNCFSFKHTITGYQFWILSLCQRSPSAGTSIICRCYMTKKFWLLSKHGDQWISNSAPSLSKIPLLLTLLATCTHSYLNVHGWMSFLHTQKGPFKEATLIHFGVATPLVVVGMTQARAKAQHHDTSHTIRILNVTVMMIPFRSLKDQPCASDAVRSATGQVYVSPRSLIGLSTPLFLSGSRTDSCQGLDKVICITFNFWGTCAERPSSSHGLHHCSLCGDINHSACRCTRN